MYAYTLRSEKDPDRFYIGLTADPERRLREHNEGKSTHTNKHCPWSLILFHWFDNEEKARAFESHLKSGSGRAFAKRHF